MQGSYSAGRATGYGEFSSGYGNSRYVDCNSALALLGFVLFVDILRDILENIITAGEEEAKRKKRWAPDGSSGGGIGWDTSAGDTEPDLLAFVSENGAQHLYHTLPEILSPALEGWWKLNGPEHPNQCLQQSVCQANFVLARDYGVAGRIIATLFSNVASHAFHGSEGEMLNAALMAAKSGRRRSVCEETYPECPNLPISYQQQGYLKQTHNTTDYKQNLSSHHKHESNQLISDIDEISNDGSLNYV